jgi:hypothetical protein
MSSGGTSTMMEYKFTGDVDQAVAAIRVLKAAEADLVRSAKSGAKEVAKGNEEYRASLIRTVGDLDKVKSKQRELTAEVQKSQGMIPKGGGMVGGGGNSAMMMQQVAFGLDDAMQQFANTGKMSSVVQAAGNNLTMLASAFGPIPVIATAAGAAVATFWLKANERGGDAKEKIDAYKKGLVELTEIEAKARGETDASLKRKEHVETVGMSRKQEWEAQQKLAEAEESLSRGGTVITSIASKRAARDAAAADLQKAQKDRRTAEGGLAGFDKAQAEMKAADRFAGSKDELKEIYKQARADGMTAELAQDKAFDAARRFVTSEKEAGAVRKLVEGIGKGVEGDLQGMSVARGLADPRKKEMEDLESQRRKASMDADAEDRRIRELMRLENRRSMTSEERAAVGGKNDVVGKLDDLIKAIRDNIEDDKRARADKLSRVIVPKGLGAVGQ